MSRREERLGRGLAALLGDSPPAPEGIQPLPLDRLEVGPFQPRQAIEPGPLEELAESIRARGVLQAILARPHPDRPGRYQIIAGERRWRAAGLAGLQAVPVHVREMSDRDAMAASMVENLQRRDLNAIEEAQGLQRLTAEFAMTQEALAGAIGKSRSHVANTIRLLQLPAAVRHEVRTGALSAGHARALIGHPDPAKAALAVIARRLSVREAEAMAQAGAQAARLGSGAAGRVRPGKEAWVRTVEGELGQALGLGVELRVGSRGGSLRIRYETAEQLEGVLRLLKR